MRNLLLAALAVSCGPMAAQCEMEVGSRRNVEYPHELRTTSGSKLPLALGRTADYYYLRLTIPADSAYLVTGGLRSVLAATIPEGLAMDTWQMRNLAEHPLDSLVLFSAEGVRAMIPKDPADLQAVGRCALNAPVPMVREGVPIAVSSRTERYESPGELLRQGGTRIALGAGALLLGSVAAAVIGGTGNEVDWKIPAAIAGAGAITWVVLTIDGADRIGRAGRELKAKGF